MDTDPVFIGKLAVILRKIDEALSDAVLRGSDLRAMRGARGAIEHIRDRLVDPDAEEAVDRPLWGIERSLPEGDRR